MPCYGITGRFQQINEFIRISSLDYVVVFLLYGIYDGLNRIFALFIRPKMAEAGTD